MTSPLVLVVDDEPAVARTVARIVASRGILTVQLTNPLEVETALADAPVGVFSDYRMPNRDGVEVLTLTKQLLPSALRVLMSATPPAHELLASLEPVHVLLKPFGQAEVFALLDRLHSSDGVTPR